MNKITAEQRAAIDARGKVIVSASAGSGKTFVMIEKLVGAVIAGAGLDSVLAVTFTKKAAAQMKEKLRSALISKINGADEVLKARLKNELKKVISADISTIHSLCAKLLRTYFYVAGVDAGFDIISSDDAVAKELKGRALDAVFERNYEEGGEDFRLLLDCFMKKRSDNSLKRLVLSAHDKVRSVAHYDRELEKSRGLYTDDGFSAVVARCNEFYKNSLKRLIVAVELFEERFVAAANGEVYSKILAEMKASLAAAAQLGIFAEKLPLSTTKKPRVTPDTAEADGEFKRFRDYITKKYNAVAGDYGLEADERAAFLKSGGAACAFADLVLQFDREYAQVKRDENKLDYNDLEHLTLALLEDKTVREEISAKYKYVFVDEYQDVNPVQEEIISSFGGEVFLVGDVKQAIYGFRGSKSLFFAEKYARMLGGEGTALRLSNNFRSADGVLDFVNALFSAAMVEEVCGFDYAENSTMVGGGKYPQGYGEAHIHIFGKEEEESGELSVYSVQSDGRKCRHTREGLAVLAIVEKALQGQHFDVGAQKFVNTECGDICILTRKNKGASTEGIIRALRDEGYKVSGVQEGNACDSSEAKTFLDILSYIDNAEQDIPLVSTMLSSLGGFSEEELAQIRIAAQSNTLPFRECCKLYRIPGDTNKKLTAFFRRIERLRALSELLSVGALADELLENYGLELEFNRTRDGVKNILRIIEEGADLPLAEFLQKLKAGDYYVGAAGASSSDSIKVMSMHAAKGLEFPVVIIADICRSFRGMDYEEIPYDEEFGFAPKAYDKGERLVSGTLLRRLTKTRTSVEELKNELNLFYVACTRAMCQLHILAEEVKPFDGAAIVDAKCYADLFDVSKFNPEYITGHAEFEAAQAEQPCFEADERLTAAIEASFCRGYGFEDSVNLPVKSSASAILRSRDGEAYEIPHQLFGGEGETDTSRGTAYHRFLELCDFSKKAEAEIAEEIGNFVESGRMEAAQAELLDASHIAEILAMPVFENLSGAVLWREREFLCRLPACEILEGVSSTDDILVQGAIDLVAQGGFGVKIIDYKYSKKDGAALKETYFLQLALYRKALSRITGTDEGKISLSIVNIYKKEQIDL